MKCLELFSTCSLKKIKCIELSYNWPPHLAWGVGSPEGPIVEIMKKKCGNKSLRYLNVWTNEFGFPTGGSLISKNIAKLEEKLKQKEQEMRRKKKISVKKLEIMEGQKECLEIWKAAAETQSKRSMKKQLPFACKKKKS